jgi:transcription initiation factor TFIID subunit 12
MSNPAPQGATGAAPQQQAGTQLLKAEDVPKLQCLSDDMKQKYRPVVHNLWSIMQTKPPGSVEHNQARQKLQDWSSRLISQERAYRAKIKAQQQQPGQPSQQSQPSQQASQSTNEQQPAQAPPPQQQPMQQPANPAQGQRPPQANPQAQIDPEIVKHVSGIKFVLPPVGPQEGTPEGDAKIKEMRNSYLMALNKQHRATQRIKMLTNMAEQRQKAGQDVPAELLTQKATMEKEYTVAKEFVETFRKKQAQYKAEHEQPRAQQQTQGQPAQQPQQPAAQQQRQPSQTSIKEEPQIKVEGGQLPQAVPAQQFANVQGGAPAQSQQPPHQNAQAPAPSLPQQPMRQPPAPLSQQNQQQGQSQMFTQPGQAHRPQINPHQANAMQQQQTNSPHPQSATSNAAGQPIPLTHQAAVTAAQRSYSNTDGGPRTATPMQQSGPGGFQAPGSREREQLNNPKMPIPRNLSVTQPVPVGMGQSRPTMSGPTNGAPGPMGQPVINKFPPFQLEGEGDRVLSKRKLDELVRQVTGGSDEALTPEVEEVCP